MTLVGGHQASFNFLFRGRNRLGVSKGHWQLGLVSLLCLWPSYAKPHPKTESKGKACGEGNGATRATLFMFGHDSFHLCMHIAGFNKREIAEDEDARSFDLLK